MSRALQQAEIGVGGSYRESILRGDTIYTLFGKYREIVPDRKLVFTHQWEEPEVIETVVVVDVTDKKGSSVVILFLQESKNAAISKGHEHGWASALRNLAGQFPESRSKT